MSDDQSSSPLGRVTAHPILLYDGVCGLCNRLTQFVLRRDRVGVFHYASLQSSLAARILTRHGANPADLDTVYVVLNHDLAVQNQSGESVLARSDAVLFILGELGGFWGAVGLASRVVPRALRELAYRFVARHRYQVFGRYDTCLLPGPENRDRFLDI